MEILFPFCPDSETIVSHTDTHPHHRTLGSAAMITLPASTSAAHIRTLYSLDSSRTRITIHGVFGSDSIHYQCARAQNRAASTLTFAPGSKDGAALLGLEVKINLRPLSDPERDTLREEQTDILAVHLGL